LGKAAASGQAELDFDLAGSITATSFDCTATD
jgi:hypothetical protein